MWFLMIPILSVLVGAAVGLATPAERSDELCRAVRRDVEASLGRAVGPPGIAEELPEAIPLRDRAAAWLRLAGLRAGFAAAWAIPLGLLGVAVGAAALSGRTRIARGERIPSPALAHVSKRLGGVAVSAAALFTSLPVTIPISLLPLCMVFAIFCIGIYLSNLPDRL